jgi:chaperonin GroES
MTLQPYYDRVLLKRKESEAKSKGGIVIPGDAQEKNNLCEVVAIGHGYLNPETGALAPLKTEVGMTVLIGKWTGDEVKVNDVDMLMVREAEILAAITG